MRATAIRFTWIMEVRLHSLQLRIQAALGTRWQHRRASCQRSGWCLNALLCVDCRQGKRKRTRGMAMGLFCAFGCAVELVVLVSLVEQ